MDWTGLRMIQERNLNALDLYGQRNIEALPLAFYEKQAADMYLMSPPCQPVSSFDPCTSPHLLYR